MSPHTHELDIDSDAATALFELSFPLFTLLPRIMRNSEFGGFHILSKRYSYFDRCSLALIRGLRGNSPCPICLVPKGHLSELAQRYPERREEDVEEKVEKVETKKAKEAVLKPLGLRAVKVCEFADTLQTFTDDKSAMVECLLGRSAHKYLPGIVVRPPSRLFAGTLPPPAACIEGHNC